MSELPIFELRDELIEALRHGDPVVVEAPTGSGKSTQIPQMMLDCGLFEAGKIVVLQPRRLATRLLAQRVAAERGCRLGEEVGYRMRLDRRVSARTRIVYATEGVLLRRLLSDPVLSDVAAIVFDEFHERHVYGDVMLARALQLKRSVRPDLRLVATSATLAAGELEAYLSPCRSLKSAGRTFPVEIVHSPKRIDFRKTPVWTAAAKAFEGALRETPEGDVLIFMPGAYEIDRTVEAIRALPCARSFRVLPLHGGLPERGQDAAVAPSEFRKVVVATNVAETSVTLPGIRLVVDSGLARIPRYDSRRGIDVLPVERISRASAEQRAGRAGRVAPGRCVRLWTEAEQAARPEREAPEIRRVDPSETMLMLKASGVKRLETFPWLDAPTPEASSRTLELLRDLGALDATGELTETGCRMSAFPVHPRYARLLLAADERGCVRQACLIAALTQERPIFRARCDGRTRARRDEVLGEEETSDFLRLMRAWSFADRNAYRATACDELGIRASAARRIGPLYERFLRIAQKEGLRVNDRAPDDEALRKCLLAAFPDRVAMRCDAGSLRCDLTRGRRGVLERDSVVRGCRLLVAAEIVEVESRHEMSVRLSRCTAIEESWLEELFPDGFEGVEETVFDSAQKRVVALRRRLFRGLELESKSMASADSQRAAELLAEEIVSGRLTLRSWDDRVERRIARANVLAEACPDFGLSPIDDSARRAMLETICFGAFSRRDLKERDAWPVVRSWLSPVQNEMLEKQMPERFRLPSGVHARIRYETGRAPVLSATIQQLYGLEETPTIGFGRIPVVVEILAPNRRPQQRTRDMRSFWKTAYPLLKKELKGRYPKHEWR